MAVLSSASTLAQVQAEYVDTASYVEDGSASKCRRFITACRILLLKLPAESGTPQAHFRMNPELIAAELKKAEQWLGGQDTTDSGDTSRPTTSLGSFRNFRD